MSFVDHDRFGDQYGAKLEDNVGRLDHALAAGFEPPPRLLVSEWAVANRRFPDDDAFPGPWKNETAPELVEVMDALSPQDPCEEVSLPKCAQSGGSASAENWVGFVSDLHPGPMLFVQATAIAATSWAAEKFWPMVEASPKLNSQHGGTIREKSLKDGSGSTHTKIKFNRSNGYVLLAGANSAPSLRQRTVRYAIEDDLDQFPDDLDKQGSPESMIDARLKVWKSRGLSKRLKISTPTIKGASKITMAYDASDKRRYYFKCCHCGDRFDPQWEHIVWPDGEPEKAALIPPCCGAEIQHWRKPELKLNDGWLSVTIDGKETPKVLSEDEFQEHRSRMPQSLKRGFHLEGMISRFQTWADMATGFVDALGDENKMKGWTNLVRGIAFEIKSGAPDHERLKDYKEQSWGFRDIPAGVCATSMGVDVQGDGVYIELVGWGPLGENWLIDARFIQGDTDVAGEGAWISLDEYSNRGVTFPGGKTFPIDQECVDAGYHTTAAQAYCALSARRLPVFGRAGWHLPVLGRGEVLRYQRQGGKSGKASKRAEDRAYLVGTYGVKLSWYGYLRQTLKFLEDENDTLDKPIGMIHFSRDTPTEWFKQVTAETVVTKTVNGNSRREWHVMPGRENHWLDCRVYNFAAAEKLMLDTLGTEDWDSLRAKRHSDVNDPKPKEQAAQLAAKNKTSGTGGETRSNWIDSGDNYLD